MAENTSISENFADKEPFQARFPLFEVPSNASEDVQLRYSLYNRAVSALNIVDVWSSNLSLSQNSNVDREEEIQNIIELMGGNLRTAIGEKKETFYGEDGSRKPFDDLVHGIDSQLLKIPLNNRKLISDGTGISVDEEEAFQRLDFIYHDIGSKIGGLYLLVYDPTLESPESQRVLPELQQTLSVAVETLRDEYPKEKLNARRKYAQAIMQYVDNKAIGKEYKINFIKDIQSVDKGEDVDVEYSRVRFVELAHNIVTNAEKTYDRDGITDSDQRHVIFRTREYTDMNGKKFVDYEFANRSKKSLPDWLKERGFEIGHSGYAEEGNQEVEEGGKEVTGTGVAMGSNRRILQEQYGGDLLIREEDDVDGKGNREVVVTVRLPVVA